MLYSVRFFLCLILKRITKSTNGWIQIIQHIWIRAITTILESETNFIVLLWNVWKNVEKKMENTMKKYLFLCSQLFLRLNSFLRDAVFFRSCVHKWIAHVFLHINVHKINSTNFNVFLSVLQVPSWYQTQN